MLVYFFLSSLEKMFIVMKEEKAQREKEGKKHLCERDTSIGWLPLVCTLKWDKFSP